MYLYREPVDFRIGINGLSILVEQSMRLNPMASA
ncbi:IS66 family insertion sequence element accessory protein TnpB, partial [Paraburkholderia tropica]